MCLSPEQNRILHLLSWNPMTIEDLFVHTYGEIMPNAKYKLQGIQRSLESLESRHRVRRCWIRHKGPNGTQGPQREGWYRVKK